MAVSLRCARFVVAMLVMCSLLACSDERADSLQSVSKEEASMGQVDGSVYYRERMMLPPGAVVEVQLQDISKADAMATVLASVQITPETGPPYPFVIKYDSATIDSRMRYALRATIALGEQLLFTSTEYIDPFGGTAGEPISIMVQRVAEPVQRSGLELEGQLWVLATLGGEPAPLGSGGKPLSLELLAQDKRAMGFSGCNRYSGGYSLEGDAEYGKALSFSQMASTMMACEDIGELERRYLQFLGLATGYSIEGQTLNLMAGQEVLATFRPQ